MSNPTLEPEVLLDVMHIGLEYCGPPGYGNGGYICGAMAKRLEGPTQVVLHAPAPLETRLNLWRSDGRVRLATNDGLTIAIAKRVDASQLGNPPQAPSLLEAEAAGQQFPGLHRDFHSGCFCCRREPINLGLKAFVGQRTAYDDGAVAGVWTPTEKLMDAEGLLDVEATWGVLDCPGSVAWVVTEGGQGGWLGTMTCEIIRRPAAGEQCIISAWRLGQNGRKRISGTALHTPAGEVLAHSHQVWIWPAPPSGTTSL